MKWLAILASMLFTASSIASHTVILPQRFANSHVVVENSPQFQSLVAKNKSLSKQIEAERKASEEFKGRVDQQLRDKQDQLDKLLAEKATQKPFWKKIPFLSILSIGVSFFGNPLGFIVGFAVKLLLGLGIAYLLFRLAIKLFRKYRK